MPNLLRITRAAAFTMAALALTACSNEPSAPVTLPTSTLTLEVPAGEWYEGDVAALRATVRDANGREQQNAPITWSVSHPTRAEVAANGTTTFLSSGGVTITAKSGPLSASRTIDVKRLTVLSISVLPVPLSFAPGDIAVLGVRVQGEGGRDVLGRAVTLTTDDPRIAVIDAAGRLRAVASGTTTVRATADGVVGSARVDVVGAQAMLSLSRVDGRRLPLLVASDSVMWDGVREYHEVFLEGGELVLSGGASPRYGIIVRYAEYRVTGQAGARTYELRLVSKEQDFGVVQYDARGDLQMTSEFISPLRHTAQGVSGGVQVHFRISGGDTYLDLLFRRD